ncbi:MAG: nicotinate-nicotinamide nucleotide adenylyltransferase [Lentisphaeria bacterium]|nr:nicotinate-nicotinamide nucleotide adenylyltransferase [Lentisphaeria bacterium]
MVEDNFSERPMRRKRPDGPSSWLPREEYVVDEVNPNEGLPFARKWRMAVFGGSFDPVHLGHVQLAREVLERNLADEVLFVPAKRSPFKASGQMDSGAVRMEMLNLALKDAMEEKPTYVAPDFRTGKEVKKVYRFGVSDMELQREGDYSYTYDTMTTLRRVYPDVELKFLMGTDNLVDLQKWYQAGALLKEFDFIIYPRPGVPGPNDVELIRIYRVFGAKLVRARLSAEDLPVWDLSSTDIRNGVARGGDFSEYLSPSVWKYIQEHKLYQKA